MLITILVILLIGLVALKLFRDYVAPLFNRAPNTKPSGVVLIGGFVALFTLVLAVLVAFRFVTLPAGFAP
jgi:hypothetical protein